MLYYVKSFMKTLIRKTPVCTALVYIAVGFMIPEYRNNLMPDTHMIS